MSLILIVVAIGLVMQLSEIENYNFKDKELKDETQAIGKSASALFVNNPKLVCELTDYRDENKVLSYISNCIPEWAVATADCGGSITACKTWDKYGKNHRAFKPVLKEFLGLPANYSCYIKVTGGKADSSDALLLSDCELSPPAIAKNVYGIDLNVMIHNEINPGTGKTITVGKNELEACIKGDTANCFMYPATIKFLVWKND